MLNLEPKSDREIYRMAVEDWQSVLAKLWSAYGKPINPAQFKVYCDTLADVPLGILEKAVTQLLKVHRFNSVPTIAEVHEAIEATEPHNWHRDLPVYRFEQQAAEVNA